MRRSILLKASCAVASFVTFAIVIRGQDQQPTQQPTPPPTQQPAPARGGVPQSPQDRAALEERLNKAWNSMSLEEKARAMRLHRGLRELPPDERKFINERIDRVLKMSTEQRRQLRQNYQRWQAMTPEQRQQAREEFRKRRQEFEQKWRKEHPGEEPPPFFFRNSTPPASAGATQSQSPSPVPQGGN
jgi:hypothetical protein